MEIEYGATVTDKDGHVLGKVNHIVHDTWTGELRKFVVRRQPPDTDLFLAPESVLEVARDKIKIKIPAE